MDYISVRIPLESQLSRWLPALLVLAGLSLFLLGLRGLPAALGASAGTQGAPLAAGSAQGFRPMLEPDTATTPASSSQSSAAAADTAAGEPASASEESGESGAAATNRPVRLAIPEIGLTAPVISAALVKAEAEQVDVYQWTAPDFFAAGWHYDSAEPGGQGNVVINGHHNAFGEVFRDLDQLRQGDRIFVYGNQNSTPFAYQVTRVFTLKERQQSLETRLENAQWIEQTDDERLTLITCWPYESNSHRLIVIAEPLNERTGGGELEMD